MREVATRVVIYTPVYSESAMETAITIITEWVPTFGIPEIVISDPDNGFASEAMGYIYQLLGVQDRQAKEREAKGAVSVMEAKHRVLNTVLADGFANGQITDGKKFKTSVKFAQIRETQTTPEGRACVAVWAVVRTGTEYCGEFDHCDAGGCCHSRQHIDR